MDIADLGRVGQLSSEMTRIQGVLQSFDRGGVIIALTVSDGPVEGSDVSPIGTTLSTIGMEYPAQMVETIRSALQQRDRDISAELASLGVTGIAQPASLAGQPRRRK